MQCAAGSPLNCFHGLFTHLNKISRGNVVLGRVPQFSYLWPFWWTFCDNLGGCLQTLYSRQLHIECLYLNFILVMLFYTGRGWLSPPEEWSDFPFIARELLTINGRAQLLCLLKGLKWLQVLSSTFNKDINFW